MSEANFSLIFSGPAVENGEIDVQDLAPTLLAAGELFQAANTAINGERVKASVRVRATSEGSFEVDFSLVHTLIDTAKSFFDFTEENKEGIAAANDLADLILKVGTPVGGGLLFLLKWLRGRKPERLEEKDGNITLYLGNISLTTSKNTLRLAEDIAVREQAKRLVAALNREGIERFSARQAEGEDLVIERADVVYFDIPDNGEDLLRDECREMILQIISLSFKEDNKWRFTDGAEPFNATIEDVDFLNKISKNEIFFAKNDYLVCIVRETQTRTTKGLKKERTIIRVIKHKSAPRQLQLT